MNRGKLVSALLLLIVAGLAQAAPEPQQTLVKTIAAIGGPAGQSLAIKDVDLMRIDTTLAPPQAWYELHSYVWVKAELMAIPGAEVRLFARPFSTVSLGSPTVVAKSDSSNGGVNANYSIVEFITRVDSPELSVDLYARMDIPASPQFGSGATFFSYGTDPSEAFSFFNDTAR